MWKNVGVRLISDRSDIPSKKALKDIMRISPERVQVYSTDAMGSDAGKTWKGDELPKTDKYTVTGPNPYTSRKWYATMTVRPNGTIFVQ